MGKTIVIGLGNPVMSDDSVGIKVVQSLRQAMEEDDSLTITEAYAGGMNLMDVMTGYEKAIIVDAMVTGACNPGTLKSFSVSDIAGTKNTVSSHDSSLAVALETGKLLGLVLPSKIRILGIEAEDVYTFGEALTSTVECAVPLAVSWVINSLDRATE